MSTLAVDSAEMERGSGTAVLRNLDLLVLAIALPVFLAAGWPLLGYAVATGAWIAQRLIHGYAESRAAQSLAKGNRNDAFKTTAISAMGRVWLVSFSVLAVGLAGEREDGLAAALLAALLFTIYLAVAALTHRGEES